MSEIIRAQKLTKAAYQAYGNVLDSDPSQLYGSANFGRAKRYNNLVDLKNLRPHKAKLNVCIFSCTAWTEPELTVAVLERHQFSTQVFMPMAAGRYITVVATGGDEPDLSALAAFIIEGPQGISYHPGIWHYPMTVLDASLDMFCLVYENGSADDCQVLPLPRPIVVSI